MSGEKSEAVAVCSTCGERLSENGDCLACLLRPALDDTVAQDPPPLLVFGDFEVARRNDGSLWELGRGGMGVTYRAVDRVLHRSVALKVIEVPRDDARNGQTVRERFLREARAAAALRHNNIAGIYHCGAVSDAGTCFYAMELVEGETLEARVRREGPLDVETALEIAIQVTAALMAAAHQGFIHRDLKPANLMLSRGEDANAPPLEVKVIDFGLAKAAASVAGELDLTHGGFVGTPAFASPEQCERGAVDARSDLYSLGVTLWYALSARVPFAGRSFEETCQLKATASLPVQQLKARNVPIPVIALVSALLARDPAERPASARELMTALQDCRRQLNAASAPAISPAALRRSRPRAALIGAGLVTVALAAAGAWWALSRTAPDRSKRAPVVIPDKSIAVLPFENLSADKDNAFFTDGVQDEILTDLAKVADLKVISRTSVMQYKSGVSRNLPEIAAQLGVANVLEGSVQRAGNQVRVNAQLIDARTDAHLWAENYDRPLDDVFAIQTEIAKTIADQLRARISPEEHAAMAEVPTRDLRALQLYQEALELENHAFDTDARALLLRAVDLLGQAISRDPKFLRAWCLLSTVHLDLYWNGFDHTEARR
jgi:TolB-like protein